MLKTKYQRVLVSFLELENFSLKKRSRISIMPLYYLTFYIVLRSGAMLPNVIFCQLKLNKKNYSFYYFSPYLAHTKNLFLDTNILPFLKVGNS